MQVVLQGPVVFRFAHRIAVASELLRNLRLPRSVRAREESLHYEVMKVSLSLCRRLRCCRYLVPGVVVLRACGYAVCGEVWKSLLEIFRVCLGRVQPVAIEHARIRRVAG